MMLYLVRISFVFIFYLSSFGYLAHADVNFVLYVELGAACALTSDGTTDNSLSKPYV